MLRKIFICAMIFTAILICGCGEDKVLGTPDKAILAFAETVLTGESPNLAASGLSEDDQKAIRYAMTNRFIDTMKSIAPLSNESAEQLTKIYFDKLKGNVKISATLKKDDSDRPIVAVTTTPIDQSAVAKSAGKNDDFIALIGMVGKLKSDSATDDQLKENPEVQKLAVTAIEKYINSLSFQPEKTFDVPCVKAKGNDGNSHWAPAEGDALINFLTGQ